MRRVLLLLPLLWACESPTGPAFPAEAVPFEPPAVYREWWARTEACAGRSADFDRVSWYVLPDAERLPGFGPLTIGAWYSSGNRIVVIGRVVHWGDVVRHEMLHAILGRKAGKHPRDAFVVRCGGTVVCDRSCLEDAGPPQPPPAYAKHVTPSSLELSLEVTPPTPSAEVWDGSFALIVSARNPTSEPLVVSLPTTGDGSASPAFRYRISYGVVARWYEMRAYAPEVAWFAPGETKRYIFDFHVGPGEYRYDLPPGTYRFSGGYGDAWAVESPVVTVAP